MSVINLTNTTWVFNESIDTTTGMGTYNINFTSNGENFVKINMSYRGYTPIVYYREDGTNVEVNYNEVWSDDAYRTITFTGGADAENDNLLSFMQIAAYKHSSTLKELLTSIANVLRSKKGTTEPIPAQNFPKEIASIEGGGYSFLNYLINVRDGDTSTLFSTGTTSVIQPVINSLNWEQLIQCSNLAFHSTFRENSSVTDITISDSGLTSNKQISLYCTFIRCTYLKKIVLDILGLINFYAAFSGCNRLETAIIRKYTSRYPAYSNNVFALGKNMFSDCYSLKTLVIKEFSTDSYSISSNTFSYCYHMLGTTHATYNPDGLQDGKIYVPDDWVDKLKGTTNWSLVANCITPLSEYVEE